MAAHGRKQTLRVAYAFAAAAGDDAHFKTREQNVETGNIVGAPEEHGGTVFDFGEDVNDPL
ncbi:hypothetical protein CCAX7_28670 [Capsulimonas corticalis]|uniref:Uncharacterized protein n=1 Tax=Capsulimonas corticalis TaxID=2219043 RepID=A0A9N7QBI4_9BACT|nr:hypothetical protein CCAX7_28670 [Capsulimonas corticalis]